MTNKFFPEIRGKFGFGCMRLPEKDGQVDVETFTAMVDSFMAAGLNYFDTARPYHGGKSELALRAALTSRYPRESYVLTDKLSGFFFHSQEEIRPLFESQLEACGVEYFDFYLMHAQDAKAFAKYKACRAYETALELKAEGKIRHFGISFHDKAEVLEQILTEYPQIEAVQIQFNYVDYDDVAVQSRKVYETCVRHGKPVIVMEPVKGGNLVTLPEEAQKIFDDLHGGSNASYALRFAAGFDNMMMVLSGMSTPEQLADNVSFMSDFQPLSETELAAVWQVRDVFLKQNLIPCTACHYCTDGCPQRILIPDLFACMNSMNIFHNWNTNFYYNDVLTVNNGKAGDCIQCGQCEDACPQHLPIRELLQQVSAVFDRPPRRP